MVGHVLRRGICSRGGGWKRAQRVLLVHRPFKTREADDGQVPVSSDKARVQTIYRTEVKEQKSSSEIYIKKIHKSGDSRLVNGNKNEVLLEEIHVPSPRLHPVVLPFLDSGDSKPKIKAAGIKLI